MNFCAPSLFDSGRKAITYAGFSWNNSCICIGTTMGYALYSLDHQLIEYEDSNEPISFVDTGMNIFSIVLIGSGDSDPSKKLNEKKVMLWNRRVKKPVGDMEFPDKVVKVLITQTK